MARFAVLVVLLALPVAASGQTLADVTLAAALASELYPGVRLPSGSLRAEGPGSIAFVAALPDSGSFAWEVYTATGLISSLQPAFVREVVNAFAVAGLFEVERTERVVAGRAHTRYRFSDGSRDAVLHVVAADGTVTWAIGRME